MDKNTETAKLWYAIHTKPHSEEMVENYLRLRIENLGFKDFFGEIFIPKATEFIVKNGRKKVQEKKIFPGYVFVQMVLNDDTWYMVRNTQDVTGFLGMGKYPTAITDDEIKRLKGQADDSLGKSMEVDFDVGDYVLINDGLFKGQEGKVTFIDAEKNKVTVEVSMFAGKSTPVTLDILAVKRAGRK